MVPPLAISNLPGFPSFFAPVKEPPSYPKSSLSSKVSGIAPQFIAMKFPFALLLSLCIALAKSSLPVPLSPNISTEELDDDIFFASSIHFLIPSLSPIMSPKLYLTLERKTDSSFFFELAVSSKNATNPSILLSTKMVFTSATREKLLPLR